MPDPFDCYPSSPVVEGRGLFRQRGRERLLPQRGAASGALNWKFKTKDVVHASPAIADGTVFVGSWDSYFYALMRRRGGRSGGSRPGKIRTLPIRWAFSRRRQWWMESYISDAGIRISTRWMP